LDAFYSTVFVAVLALFGLLVAALIFAAQMVGDRYSTKIAQRLLTGRRSLTFWLVGALTLLMSSARLLTLSFPFGGGSARIVALWEIPKYTVYGFCTLLAVLFTVWFFWRTLCSYSRLVSPLGVLEELARDLDVRKIRDIAILRLYQSPTRDEIKLAKFAPFPIGDPNQVNMPTSENEATNASCLMKVDAGRTFPWISRLRSKLGVKGRSSPELIKAKLCRVEKCDRLEDPLADFFEYALLAIEKNNALAWKVALRRVVAVFQEAVQDGLLAKDSDIPFLADELLLQWLGRATDEIQISRRRSFVLDLCTAVEEICTNFLSAGIWERLDGFLAFFQCVGAQAIEDVDKFAFGYSIRALAQVGSKCLDDQDAWRVFEDVSRKVGWLGEKLILRGIEDAPIMPSGDETEELGELIEAVSGLADATCNAKADSSTHVIEYAIETICRQIFERNEPEKFWKIIGSPSRVLSGSRPEANHSREQQRRRVPLDHLELSGESGKRARPY